MRTRTHCCTLAIMLNISLVAAAAEPAPRAARSVHLGYVAPEANLFYNELTVEQSVPGSYFMACGFNHGYYGIQEQGKGKKVVIFSVWDPTKGDDARAVPEDQRVEILYRDKDVLARRFGGEGTGGQSFFDYDWKIGTTYRFLVKATIEEKKTAYAAFFYLPEQKTWKHLITFRTRTGGDRLKGLYSFIEDFRRDGKSAKEVRRAVFGNGWVCDAKASGNPWLKARFTASGRPGRQRRRSMPALSRIIFIFKPAATPTRTLPCIQRDGASQDGQKPPQVPEN